MDSRSDLARSLTHARALTAALAVLAAALWVASGTYSMGPEQRGVVLRFGAVREADVPPGIHYHLPWPVERVERVRTTEVRTLRVAFQEPNEPGGTAHDALLTADENLVLATLLLQYTVKAPADFLLRTANPEGLLERLVAHAAVVRLAGMGVDQVLTTARQELQLGLRDDVQVAADTLGLGVRVHGLQVQRLEPPSLVASAFKDVGSAREDRQKLVEEARGEHNRRLPEARAEADRVRSEASSRAQELRSHSAGEAARFLSSLAAYRATPAATAKRLHLETMEAVLPRARKIINNPRADRPTSP
jgi:membrane protease subunit HflK